MTNLFETMGGFLTGPIGNNLDNNPEDVLRAKRNFKTIGLYDGDTSSPYIDRALTDAIRNFQQKKSLRIDGIMKPDGETERTVQKHLYEHFAPTSTAGLGKHQMQGGMKIEKETTGREPRQQPPAPPQKLRAPVSGDTQILTNVPDQELKDFIRQEEGNKPYFYRDSANKVTVGIGDNVDNLARAEDRPLWLHDESNNPIRPATADEIKQAHDYAKNKPGDNLRAEAFDPKNAPDIPNIRLREGDAEKQFEGHLRRDAKEIRDRIPDFDKLPPEAQKAILDMQYNMGTGNFSKEKWPKFYDAIRERDWEKAAKESHRKNIGDDRNKKTEQEFRKINTER